MLFTGHKKTGCKSRFFYAPKKLMHDFKKNVTRRNKQLIQRLSVYFKHLIEKLLTSYPQIIKPSAVGFFHRLAAANPGPVGWLRSKPLRGR